MPEHTSPSHPFLAALQLPATFQMQPYVPHCTGACAHSLHFLFIFISLHNQALDPSWSVGFQLAGCLTVVMHVGGAEKHAGAVQSTLDGATGAALMILLPSISYLTTHAPTMPSWHHFWSLLLLTSLPTLYLLSIKVNPYLRLRAFDRGMLP